MPAFKSARKQLKISKKRHMRNVAARSAMKTAIKKVRTTADSAAIQSVLRDATSIIDKTAKKGVLHVNAASRYKSKLARFANSLSSA